jgi:hypothetical protein
MISELCRLRDEIDGAVRLIERLAGAGFLEAPERAAEPAGTTIGNGAGGAWRACAGPWQGTQEAPPPGEAEPRGEACAAG